MADHDVANRATWIDRFSNLPTPGRSLILLSPAFVLIGAFGLAPLGLILVYSFLVPGTYGGVVWEFSAEAYIQFLFERDIFDGTLAFNSSYLQIGARSVILAGVAVAGCLLIGFPTAYFIATRRPGLRNILIFLVTVPFWTNLLVRTFSMMLILRDQGPLNTVLMGTGITGQPLSLLYTDFAIGLGLLYSFLPFMVLPIYASLERIDFRLVEAAYDLYANRWKVLQRILIPLSLPGIAGGSFLVFILSLSSFLAPDLLGGGKHLMIGNLIAQQFGTARNWPFGAAAAMILLALVLIALMFYARQASRRSRLAV